MNSWMLVFYPTWSVSSDTILVCSVGDKVLQEDPVPNGGGHGGDVQQALFFHMLDLVKE